MILKEQLPHGKLLPRHVWTPIPFVDLPVGTFRMPHPWGQIPERYLGAPEFPTVVFAASFHGEQRHAEEGSITSARDTNALSEQQKYYSPSQMIQLLSNMDRG